MAERLPWTYPRGFWCHKCHNTGYKLKNGRSCKDCWDRFARQSNVQYVNSPSTYNDSLRIPFTNWNLNDDLSVTYGPRQQTVYHQPQPYIHQPVQTPAPAPVQLPSEPPPYEIYQQVPQASPGSYNPNQTQYRPQQPVPQPSLQQLPPRVVRPGDPSLGGVLCGKCRGSGRYTPFLLDEELCNVCHGVGRILK